MINSGVSGYSTDQELLWYKNEGIKYETDLVILVVAGNDVGDNTRERVYRIYYKPKYIIENGRLILTGTPVPKSSPQRRFVYSLTQRSALAHFLTQRHFDLQSLYAKTKSTSGQSTSTVSDTKAEKDPFKLTIALIDEIKNTAESKNAKFMIVTTNRWWYSPSKKTYKSFIGTLQAHGFLVLDVESMPAFNPKEVLIADDGHWSRAGHEFVAEKIQEVIETHQLISGSPKSML